jgi:uncharacterized protein with HEPN domain
MLRDEAYLLDMLIAARKAIEFVRDITWFQFKESELHQNAVLHPLEVIGEAARLISDETRRSHPEIPWTQVIGMRNRLIHEYLHIDLRTVWDTIHDDLPNLIEQLEPLIPPEDQA